MKHSPWLIAALVRETGGKPGRDNNVCSLWPEIIKKKATQEGCPKVLTGAKRLDDLALGCALSGDFECWSAPVGKCITKTLKFFRIREMYGYLSTTTSRAFDLNLGTKDHSHFLLHCINVR